MGPVGQRTPHVIETRTEQAALLYWRSQSSPTANLSAVTSSHDDLHDVAHRLSYVGGLLIGASGYGGYYGSTAGRNDDDTSEEATAKQAQARTSIRDPRRNQCAS